MIDVNSIVLLHPASYGLRGTLVRLLNRAEAASDTAQSDHIQLLFDDLWTAAQAGATLQEWEMPSDPTGHYGIHLKWQAKDLLYKATQDSSGDIYTDIQSIGEGTNLLSLFDYNGTVLINDMGGTFYGTTLEADFTPSDSCGLPLLLASRWNAFFGFTGNICRVATSGDETLYSSIDVTIPEFSASPITFTLTTTNWEITSAPLYAWLQTQVGNTVGFQVTGTPA